MNIERVVGHVNRMVETSIPNQILNYQTKERRRVGRIEKDESRTHNSLVLDRSDDDNDKFSSVL